MNPFNFIIHKLIYKFNDILLGFKPRNYSIFEVNKFYKFSIFILIFILILSLYVFKIQNLCQFLFFLMIL